MIKSVLLPLMVAFGLLAASEARAHAVLLESTPPAEAEVVGDKVEFHLKYNSRIDARRSRLSLKGPGGDRTIAPRQGGNEAELVARVEGLAPGRYTLFWDVLSVDGHVSRGQVPFLAIAP
ncbi:Copper resistance protein CopC [Paramagnetospirillum magnetotacticum MS-1]|uniref:Copper resistance protein CopC n=1 Tax=Paramagnetospirillum magnetotacticum MS-1 TaxID=272627 RepID=A0A0C2YEL6_PARME|nr:copper resistance CopC family protein [Paramagnetospirillum magnetotacticum]KIL98129.1 Copper resistance protein CopC [Paramagnetospirillum magnetotacticum MS-1]